MKKLLTTLGGIILVAGIAHLLYDSVRKKPTSFDSLNFSELNFRIDYASALGLEQSLIKNKNVTHLETPDPVKSFYISSWVAGSAKNFAPIIAFIDTSEINAVTMDIKDATGRVSFLVDDDVVTSTGSPENRIENIRELIQQLHEKNIYVIGRISVFQDPYMTKIKPEWAITKKSDGTVWKDYKGLSFLDPAKKEVWNYIVALAGDSFDVGFDEVNFDYIRYPSDGDMEDIDYKLQPGETRADHLKEFFAFLSDSLKTSHPSNYMSADLFGFTTTMNNDLGIGQIWEYALPYFDYLSPMVYPSHYGHGSFGLKNPAEKPYETITYAMKGAIAKTEKAGFSRKKIRPWLQDFNMGAIYDSTKVRDQIQAAYDVGITSWMMWDASNTYTYDAYQKDSLVVQ